MYYFIKILFVLSILRIDVDCKALAGAKKTFQFELVPFKHISIFLEHLSPFGKFELKHSLEKRDTVDEIVPNEIPGALEEKKVMLTSVVVPPVEVPPAPIPVPLPEQKPVLPFTIELAPNVVPVVPVIPEPAVKEVVPVVPVVPKVPVMYTDITQLPLYNFGVPKPVPIQLPYPIKLEVPVKPEPIVAVPVEPVPPVEVQPEPPVEPVPVVPVEPVPVPVFTEPTPVVEVPVKPEVVAVPEVKPAIPPLPNYLIKGSRIIIFFGSKILQMLSQFVDGKTFAEFTLPPPPPLPALAKKK